MQNFRLRIDQDHWNLPEPKVFSGGEIHVDLSGMPSKCNDYNLRARCQSSDDIMHMLLMADALSRRYPESRGSITIPYIPYARQDRVCSDGQHFGLQQFLWMLTSLGVNQRVVFVDVHSEVAAQLLNFYEVDYLHIPQHSVVKMDEELPSAIATGAVKLVSPDKGAITKTVKLIDKFGGLTPAYGSKVRDPSTGQLTGFDVDVEDFEGQDLLICDDICDGGGTFVGLAEVLKERNCGEITLYVTHGIFSRGLDIFKGYIDNVITTDTFKTDVQAVPAGVNFRRIKIL